MVDSFVQHAGFRLDYAIDRDALGDPLAALLVPLTLDDAARSFIDGALIAPHGTWKTRLHAALAQFAPEFEVNGVLGMYPMHFLSTPQLEQLLKPSGLFEHALDVGAGNGDVSQALAPLAQRLTVTEASWAMRRRLRRRGFALGPANLEQHSQTYDLVCCFNVLDRTRRPATLLKQVVKRLRLGGKLIVSVPLPLRPFYFSGATSKTPEEPLPVFAEHWEESLCQFAQWMLQQVPGMRVEALTRAPYLSGGDARRSLYVLDAAAVVLSVQAEPDV